MRKWRSVQNVIIGLLVIAGQYTGSLFRAGGNLDPRFSFYEAVSKMPLMAVLLISLYYELARASDVFQVNVNVVSAFGAGLVIVLVPIWVVL